MSKKQKHRGKQKAKTKRQAESKNTEASKKQRNLSMSNQRMVCRGVVLASGSNPCALLVVPLPSHETCTSAAMLLQISHTDPTVNWILLQHDAATERGFWTQLTFPIDLLVLSAIQSCM